MLNFITSRLKSFGHAFEGLSRVFLLERNMWIHTLAAVVVIILGFVFDIEQAEWLAVIIAIGMVWVAEIFNTAIEKIADFISPGFHQNIKAIKDVSAGGVLIAAITAAIIGIIVFGKYFVNLL